MMISKEGHSSIFPASYKETLILKIREIKFYFPKPRKQQLLTVVCISTIVYFSINFFIKSHEIRIRSNNEVIQNFGNDTTASFYEAIKRIKNIPNFPYITKTLENGPKFLGNSSCAKFPTVLDIRFSNTIWQIQKTPNWTFQIFGAYLDNRKESSSDLNSIRILGVIDRNVENITAFCQIWFSDRKEPLISKVTDFNYLFYGKRKCASAADEFLPFLWKCPYPNYINEIPDSVSIVENVCDNATNNIRVNYETSPFGKMEKIAVCMKGLDYLNEDVTIKLIEWIETLKVFGTHKIFFYNFYVRTKTKKILEYYMNNGDIDVSPITYPHSIPNERHLRNYVLNAVGEKDAYKRMYLKLSLEAIPYNDCLYRNMYKYEYLTAIDIDELFVPNMTPTWHDMLHQLEEKYPDKIITHFVFKNNIFLPEKALSLEEARKFNIPDHFSMLKSIYRGCAEVPINIKWPKSIFRPMKVLSILNHYPLQCLFGVCNEQIVDSSIAKLHHYRTGFLSHEFCQGNEYIKDRSLWRWKKEIIQNSSFIVEKMRLM